MPALSFQEKWLDKLLSGAKCQTTRPQTDRIKVGDICTIYNQQRRRIVDKPLRKLTEEGLNHQYYKGYISLLELDKGETHAHLLGKVEITNVYVIYPHEIESRMNHVWTWESWARKDGFATLHDAEEWFKSHYGEEWLDHNWTVIQWAGWLERYFEPMELI